MLACAPGVNSTPICELTLTPAALWRKYDAATPKGPLKARLLYAPYLHPLCSTLHPLCSTLHPLYSAHHVCRAEQVSKSSFLAYLDQPCFRLQTCKSCLCGPCEEHGWQNFEDLNVLIKVLTTY